MTNQHATSAKLIETLTAISDLEREHEFLGVCFSKVSDFVSEPSKEQFLKAEEVAPSVLNCLKAALVANQLELQHESIFSLEPVEANELY